MAKIIITIDEASKLIEMNKWVEAAVKVGLDYNNDAVEIDGEWLRLDHSFISKLIMLAILEKKGWGIDKHTSPIRDYWMLSCGDKQIWHGKWERLPEAIVTAFNEKE